jgi:hypothetical protein
MKKLLFLISYLMIMPTVILTVWGIRESDANLASFGLASAFISVVFYTIADNIYPKLKINR